MKLRRLVSALAVTYLSVSTVATASAEPETPTTEATTPESTVEHDAPAQHTDGNLVMFGDSITANPTAEQARDENTTCAQDPNNMARQIARNLAVEPRDFSCSGAGVASQGFLHGPTAKAPGLKSFDSQVNTALDSNQLDHQTKYVVILIGFNDTYNLPLDGLDPKSQMEIISGEQYPTTLHPLQPVFNTQHYNWGTVVDYEIPRIKEAAPNAKIVFSSYPAITDQDNNLCLVHLQGVPVIPTYIPWISAGLDNVNQWSLEASQRHETEFVDLNGATLPNNMCAPDELRDIPGIIDNTTEEPWNLPVHPTARGVEVASVFIADSIR